MDPEGRRSNVNRRGPFSPEKEMPISRATNCCVSHISIKNGRVGQIKFMNPVASAFIADDLFIAPNKWGC